MVKERSPQKRNGVRRLVERRRRAASVKVRKIREKGKKMKDFSLEEFRVILDKAGVVNVKSDNALVVSLDADKNFGYDATAVFTVEDKRVRVVAGSANFQAPRANRLAALEFCNNWNKERTTPRAFLDPNGYFGLDWSLYVDVDLAASYLETKFVAIFLTGVREFFKEAERAFDEIAV